MVMIQIEISLIIGTIRNFLNKILKLTGKCIVPKVSDSKTQKHEEGLSLIDIFNKISTIDKSTKCYLYNLYINK